MTTLLDRAFASTRSVLEQVRAEHLDAPTPCASWDVRALIEHFIGTARWAAGAVELTTPKKYAPNSPKTNTPKEYAVGGAEGSTPQEYVGGSASGEYAPDSAQGSTPKEYGLDLLAAYDESRNLALAAFETEGVLVRTLALPFGEFTGAALLALITCDQFTHGWDLARALGLSTDLDPEAATEILAQARLGVRPEYRGPDGVGQFGPALDAPTGASPADQLAAFLGRAV